MVVVPGMADGAMCEQFEIDERQCAVDLDRFLEELREGGLLPET